MKQTIRLYIIPTYKNPYVDEYYLFDQNNKNTLDVVWLDNALIELKNNYNILQTEICGGEITVLSDFYFNILFQLIKMNCNKIIVSTNFIDFNKSIINLCDIINVKYNFNGYSKYKTVVYNNIKAAIAENKIINLKSLDISCKNNHKLIIEDLNRLKIKSWEIIPYHQSIYSKAIPLSYTEYDPNIDGDRQRVINQFDDLKFSKDNQTWREYLEKEFPSQGTRTNLEDVNGRDDADDREPAI